VQVEVGRTDLTGRSDRLLRSGEESFDPVVVGEAALDIASHRGDLGSGVAQSAQILARPVPDLHCVAKVADPSYAVEEGELGEHHFGADGQSEGAAD